MITLTAPVTEPVTLLEAKLHLKLITNPADASAHPDDTAVADKISEAREYCEEFCGRAFADGTYRATGCGFDLALLYPMASIASVKYLDADGAEQTLAGTVYEINGNLNGLRLKIGQSWPAIYARDDAVRVEFASATPVVPELVKAAIKLLVGDLYYNRQTIITGTIASQIAMRAQDLLMPHRIGMGV